MIKEIVKLWEYNKEAFKQVLSIKKLSNYKQLFELIVEHIFNQNEYSNENFDLDNLKVIDDGDYQGTIIFIIPKDTYQPSAEDYLWTSVGYGSCSGCDTLQGINSEDYDYDCDVPTESQVEQYMTLALHIIQKAKYLKD